MTTVCLPPEVLRDDAFLYQRGKPVLFDLSGTGFLATPAVAGLLAAARHAPVRLRLAPGSAPAEKLRRMLGPALKPDPDAADLWTLSLTP